MCCRDWYEVSKPLRDHVWRTWHSGQKANSCEHQEAVLKAITAARLARLPRWRRQLVRLWLAWVKQLPKQDINGAPAVAVGGS
jgi:hypothetical protein